MQELGQDLQAGCLRHRRIDEVAHVVNEEPIAPEREHVVGLPGEVRLMMPLPMMKAFAPSTFLMRRLACQLTDADHKVGT